MSVTNYIQQKFRLGTVYGGRLGDDRYGPALELPLVGGIAPMLLGDRRPCIRPMKTIPSYHQPFSFGGLGTVEQIQEEMVG